MDSSIELTPLELVAMLQRRGVTFSALVQMVGADRQAVERTLHEAMRRGWIVTVPRLPATAGFGNPSNWTTIERAPHLVATSAGLDELRETCVVDINAP